MTTRPINLGGGPFPSNPASSDTIYSAFLKTNENVADLDGRITALETVEGERRAAGGALAAPHLLRGTVSGKLWGGVATGPGAPQEQRRANMAGLQAAIHFASSNRKFFELEPGLFEIEGMGGLLVPASKDGFQWRGSKGSILKQFSSNSPVLTIGDVTESARDCQDLHFSGVRVCYAADQWGNAGSSALRLGLLRNCTIEQVSVLADYGAIGPLIKAYRGIHVASAGSRFGFFSNTLRDIVVGGAVHSLLDIALVGTGSVFSNVYLTQGVTGHPAPILDSPLRIRGEADQYETVFEQLNIEWCIARTLIQAQSCRSTSFISTHLEGNQLVGHAPSAVLVSTSQINLIGVNILDLGVRASDIVGKGTPALLRCYGDNAITGSNIQVSWSARGRVDTGVDVVALSETSPADAQQIVSLAALTVRDPEGGNARFLSLDRNMPAEEFPTPSAVERYVYGEMLSHTRNARLATSVSVTLFGQAADPMIQYPAALGAARTVTLSNRMASGRLGGAIPPLTGALAAVRRNSGVADRFDLVVANHDGVPLATIRASGTTMWFRFDGVNWAIVA